MTLGRQQLLPRSTIWELMNLLLYSQWLRRLDEPGYR